ncbi:hypothetical protein H312_03358 [Anncaliia algerae PRA339]|uniref:Uncharacterized protein n=1 Tax=Anncaliia algerae PRA339 TaxID=1288291 RepID=A0A059EW33_9MICR|nr:hypothetical protein H312_03358 [Anncaliia algerae PRA339]
MLNFKNKNQHVRAPNNKSDSLCIVEFNGRVVRAYATTISNKEVNISIHIIWRNVLNVSIIRTDKQKS